MQSGTVWYKSSTIISHFIELKANFSSSAIAWSKHFWESGILPFSHPDPIEIRIVIFLKHPVSSPAAPGGGLRGHIIISPQTGEGWLLLGLRPVSPPGRPFYPPFFPGCRRYQLPTQAGGRGMQTSLRPVRSPTWQVEVEVETFPPRGFHFYLPPTRVEVAPGRSWHFCSWGNLMLFRIKI